MSGERSVTAHERSMIQGSEALFIPRSNGCERSTLPGKSGTAKTGHLSTVTPVAPVHSALILSGLQTSIGSLSRGVDRLKGVGRGT